MWCGKVVVQTALDGRNISLYSATFRSLRQRFRTSLFTSSLVLLINRRQSALVTFGEGWEAQQHQGSAE